jgi:hypothetical protein
MKKGKKKDRIVPKCSATYKNQRKGNIHTYPYQKSKNKMENNLQA